MGAGPSDGAEAKGEKKLTPYARSEPKQLEHFIFRSRFVEAEDSLHL